MRVAPCPAPLIKTLLWPNEQATQAFAHSLAAQAGIGNAFIALHGDLGAGKTTLVRHLLRALGESGRVKSPTYAVVEPYEIAGLQVWHFDFYRFNDPLEWEDAGFREIFASTGLKIAEWPEKAGPMLPTADLDISIQTQGETERSITLAAHSAVGIELLNAADRPGAAA